MLRRTSMAAAESLPRLVARWQRHPAYLRHAPSSMYITCDTVLREDETAPMQRHRTKLLDMASDTLPAQSSGVYVLTTTSMDDIKFENSDGGLSSILVGLPTVSDEAAAKQFVQQHEASLQGVRLVVLPDLDATAGTVLRALRNVLPSVKVAGSAFSKAFMSDPTFFAGVRKAVVDNDPHAHRSAIAFPEMAADDVTLLEDGATIPVHTDAKGRRALRVVTPISATREARLKKQRKRRPPHFEYQPLFMFDNVFHSMHVGTTLCRLPWLPQVVTEASRDVVLPVPPLLAAGHAPEGALLQTWHIEEAAEAVAAALRREADVQHVLSHSYGALPGDVEDVIASVENASDELELLRSRLAKRLETDTGRDIGKWSDLLLKKVLDEVLCPNTSAQPTTAETKQSFHEWATTSSSLGRLSAVLAQSAFVLPPTTLPQEATSSKSEGAAAAHEADDSVASGLEGSAGVTLMQSIMEKKGLQGLNSIVAREEIDVTVFTAMSQEDFRRIFKATFGVSKRLEALQRELKEKM